MVNYFEDFSLRKEAIRGMGWLHCLFPVLEFCNKERLASYIECLSLTQR